MADTDSRYVIQEYRPRQRPERRWHTLTDVPLRLDDAEARARELRRDYPGRRVRVVPA